MACLVVIGLLLGLLGGGHTSAQQSEFAIRAIEVTQAQQADPRGSVPGTPLDPLGGAAGCASPYEEVTPLIAKRRTGVRVYVTLQDAAPLDVRGRLTVKLNGSPVWSGWSLNILRVEHTEVCEIPRDLESSTLNFEVPYKEFTIGFYDFEVQVNKVGQSVYTGPVFSKSSVVALNRRPLRILGVPIKYLPLIPEINTGLPTLARLKENVAETLLWAAWPLTEPTGNKRYHFQYMPFTVDYQIGAGAGNHCKLTNELELYRRTKSPRPDFLYGWVKGSDAFGYQGWTCEDQRAGAGSDKPYDYKKTFAHEFGHSLGGLPHNEEVEPVPLSAVIEETGWDVLLAVRSLRGVPEDDIAIMHKGSPAGGNTDTWSHIEQYRWLTEAGASWGSSGSGSPFETLVVGLSRANESAPWTFGYGFELTSAPDPIEPLVDPTARGELRLLDVNGSELYTTDVREPLPSEPGMAGANWLLVETPQLSGVHSGEFIWDGQVQTAITRTASAPQITITSPAPGSTLGITTTVTWSLTDTDGDPLVSMLEYSHNAGTTVAPLSRALTGTAQSVVVSTDDLPAGSASWFRVRASDSLNTATEAVEDLVVGPDKPPLAYIIAPENGRTYLANVLPIFVGGASDLEDGAIPEHSMTWTSSIDGYLGAGEMIEVGLSVGTHIITLQVTDSASQVATDSITVIQQ